MGRGKGRGIVQAIAHHQSLRPCSAASLQEGELVAGLQFGLDNH